MSRILSLFWRLMRERRRRRHQSSTSQFSLCVYSIARSSINRAICTYWADLNFQIPWFFPPPVPARASKVYCMFGPASINPSCIIAKAQRWILICNYGLNGNTFMYSFLIIIRKISNTSNHFPPTQSILSFQFLWIEIYFFLRKKYLYYMKLQHVMYMDMSLFYVP
jgi:hypothetical protein